MDESEKLNDYNIFTGRWDFYGPAELMEYECWCRGIALSAIKTACFRKLSLAEGDLTLYVCCSRIYISFTI